MSCDTVPGERDVLSGIAVLRVMCPNGEMPKEFRAGFWRLMDDVNAEVTRLRAENRKCRLTLRTIATQRDSSTQCQTDSARLASNTLAELGETLR